MRIQRVQHNGKSLDDACRFVLSCSGIRDGRADCGTGNTPRFTAFLPTAHKVVIEVLYGFPSPRAQFTDPVTTKKEDDRRGSQRITLPKPVPASLSGFEGKLLEISLIGCLVEHVDRVLPKARLPLRFKWRGSEVRIEVTVIRSEMRIIFGRP